MGAGKSSVGRRLASLLSWEFQDFDTELESREGMSIGEIFAIRGAAEFRLIEASVGAELLARTDVVLATGGGWPVGPGRLDALESDTLSVWLRVSAEEAVRRASADPIQRPLLDVEEPMLVARELLAAREAFYCLADVTLDTEGVDPQRLAGEILRRVEERPTSGRG